MSRLDHAWHWLILVIFALALAVNALLAWRLNDEVLLASVPRGERLAVYNATSAAAGPLLGFVVAAVAALVALPDRPSVDRLKTLTAWRLLPKMLLFTATLLTLTMVLTVVGQAADASREGDVIFEMFVFASMVGSLFGLVVSGLAFGMAVAQVHDQDSED